MTCKGCGDRDTVNESGYCNLCEKWLEEMCLRRNQQQEDNERAEAHERKE